MCSIIFISSFICMVSFLVRRLVRGMWICMGAIGIVRQASTSTYPLLDRTFWELDWSPTKQ